MFENIRSDFPLYKKIPDLVYLDSAATALKPESVLLAMDRYYREYSSNVSRGLYPLADQATMAVDEARQKVASFVGNKKEGIVFVASATQAINTVSLGLLEHVKKNNNIVVTELEHHSNFLPWKELSRLTGAELRIAKVDKDGFLDETGISPLVDDNTSIVAFTAVSNVTGLINPVGEIIRTVRKKNKNTLILIDICQAAGHIPISQEEWDADFLVFSAHKLFGPTGVGVLSGKPESLSLLRSVNVGGGTVLDALTSPVTYKQHFERLEGGTPNIAGIVGLGAAIDYLNGLGIKNVRNHEKRLVSLIFSELQEAFGKQVAIVGSQDKEKRTSIVSFTHSDMHPHDMAHLLGEKNICIRAGEQCARPLHNSLHIDASARISLSVYNTEEDISKLIHELKAAFEILVS